MSQKHAALKFFLRSWLLCILALGSHFAHAKDCGAGGSKRQTILIVDDSLVTNDEPEKNGRWTQVVFKLLDASVDSSVFDTMEPLSIAFMNKTTGDLRTEVDTCFPKISEAALAKLRESDSWWGSFFGSDSDSVIEAMVETFKNEVMGALGNGIKSGSSHAVQDASEGSLALGLKRLRNYINLSKGVPRVFLLVGLDNTAAEGLTSASAAKLAGIASAKELGLDLARSEVYIIQLGDGLDQKHRAFLNGLLLGGRGLLIDVTEGSLPRVQLPPKQLRVFAGELRLDQSMSVPITLRVAADADGGLVNSWIEITVFDTVATPISGKMSCKSNAECSVIGDGRLMGQAWNPAEGGDPVFDDKFGWQGLRQFNMKILDNQATVEISDDNIELKVDSPDILPKRNGWKFSLTEMPANDIR